MEKKKKKKKGVPKSNWISRTEGNWDWALQIILAYINLWDCVDDNKKSYMKAIHVTYVYLSVPIYISIHWSTNINSLYIYNGYIILIMYLFHIVYIYMYTVTNEYKALW